MNTDSPDALSTEEPSRRQVVLKLLRDSGEPRTIVDLAAALDVHPNTVRFHLESLAHAGRVERIVGVKVGRGRPPTKYAATAGMDPDGPTSYRLLATMLTSHFAQSSHDPAADAQALGRAWSETLMAPTDTRSGGASRSRSATSRGRAVARVAGVLADLGFAPEPVDARSTQIRLRHCPFLDLVPENSEVICALHLGLMQGAFDTTGSSVTVAALDAFVEPDLCVARLAPTRGTATRGSGQVSTT